MNSHSPLCLGILASHGGSNLQAILDAIASGGLPAKVGLVVSNNSQAMALERARRAGVPALHVSAATHGGPEGADQALALALRNHGVNLVVLAGYMKKIGPALLGAFPRRILNIHPALLPKFGGQGHFGIHVHQAVLAAAEKESGATVHLVDGEYDKGAVVAQARVPVEPGDTPETLQARVLKVEHQLYPQVLAALARGELDLDQL
ncbi:MAG: phosphoribosylglycinamide formyltransferase [Deltaproteobacteria bacterium]|nr:phosphoribosylglycinamide formyltransferase [Deltaproteobacteria bacterium]